MSTIASLFDEAKVIEGVSLARVAFRPKKCYGSKGSPKKSLRICVPIYYSGPPLPSYHKRHTKPCGTDTVLHHTQIEAASEVGYPP